MKLALIGDSNFPLPSFFYDLFDHFENLYKPNQFVTFYSKSKGFNFLVKNHCELKGYSCNVLNSFFEGKSRRARVKLYAESLVNNADMFVFVCKSHLKMFQYIINEIKAITQKPVVLIYYDLNNSSWSYDQYNNIYRRSIEDIKYNLSDSNNLDFVCDRLNLLDTYETQINTKFNKVSGEDI